MGKMFVFFVGLLAFGLPVEASILDVPAGERSLEFITLIQDSIIAPMSAVLNIGCLLFPLFSIW